jgi:hypothetical protein
MAYNKKKGKKDIVVSGIPMYPDYLDGQIREDRRPNMLGGIVTLDKYGNWMSAQQQTALAARKKKQREDWRNDNPNIKNKVKEEDV